ncbi:MAG: uncharacterized protein QOC89_4064 [Paraburkholderia sp.]|uniref:hypothetical protein n=1 Tax=Paraburkholderia sp. TaxID=1926495 RepID=UPI002AFE2E64|nr:hypothetical protein [Paraburkholderia sp.]MEA3086367.1 uncharacterized protein [Paraburkholderia sp.]
MLRIISQPAYPNTLDTPAAVAPVVAQLRSHRGHQFWPDEVSLLDLQQVDASKMLKAEQVTDTYLLALARVRGGALATFDRRLMTDAVRDGARHLELIR